MIPDLPVDRLTDYLRKMLVIRRFEEALITLAGEFDVGHFHVYIGQEPTGVAALAQFEQGDLGFTTHRNHGHLLARGTDPAAMFAEILGKVSGTNSGKGGTLHLSSVENGFPATSAATGGCTPLATGAAFAFSRLGIDRVSGCLFGAGALEEGTFHESISIAALEALPVIYLCENNSLEALGQKANEYPSSTMAAAPLTDLASSFKVPTVAVDGTDVGVVYRAMATAIRRARGGGGPTFIETLTVRRPGSRPLWPQLVTGPTNLAYAWDESAIPSEYATWHGGQDGLLRYLREMLFAGCITQDEAPAMDEQVTDQMRASVQFALDSPYPPVGSALESVYA